MDLKRPAEHFERLLLLAELLQDHAETRQGAEMAGLAAQHLTDVLHRLAELLAHVMNGGAAVPGLDIVRLELDDGVEELKGEVELVGVGRGLTRPISRLAVSLPDAIHSAQIRPSTSLALSASGAALSAPNRKSRLRVRSPCWGRGKSLGGCIGSMAWAGGWPGCGTLWAKADPENSARTVTGIIKVA